MAKKGEHLSPEHRKKLCEAWTPERRNKFGDDSKGNKHGLGYRHTDAAKLKISESCKSRVGPKNGHWRGGRNQRRGGYVLILCPNHPYANNGGYVCEHRLVMEAHLGRVLLPTEVVHHINGIVDDNRYENLMLFSSSGEHSCFHRKKPPIASDVPGNALSTAQKAPGSPQVELFSFSRPVCQGKRICARNDQRGQK